MILTIEEVKKVLISQVEKLTTEDIDTNEDGSIVIQTRLYRWASDDNVHDEKEPREAFERYLNG